MLWISIMLNLWPSKVYSLIKIQSEYNNHYENEGLCIFCTLCTLHTLNALGTLDFQLYFGRPYDTWLPTVLSSMITIFNYIGRHEDPTVFKYKKCQMKNVISYLFLPILYFTLWTSLEHLNTHYILITYLHKNLHISKSHWIIVKNKWYNFKGSRNRSYGTTLKIGRILLSLKVGEKFCHLRTMKHSIKT